MFEEGRIGTVDQLNYMIYIYCLEESNPLLGQDAVWGPNLEEFRKGVFNYCAVSRFVLKLNGTA